MLELKFMYYPNEHLCPSNAWEQRQYSSSTMKKHETDLYHPYKKSSIFLLSAEWDSDKIFGVLIMVSAAQ